MGYTHYWNQYSDFTDEEWDFAREFFHKGLELLAGSSEFATTAQEWDVKSVVIRGWDGIREPEFTDERVSFNGDRSQGLDHESFVVQKIHSGYQWNPTQRFDFCKTARKPYDVLVVAMLMMFHEMNPWFEWSSDGGDQHRPEMDGGRRLYCAILDALSPWPCPEGQERILLPSRSVIEIKLKDLRTEHQGAKYEFIDWPPKAKEA